MRASLRLLRPALGSQTYTQENAIYRDMARPFTRVRDAKVLMDTLDQLVAGNGEQAMALDSTPVRQALREDYQAIRCHVLEDDARSRYRPSCRLLGSVPNNGLLVNAAGRCWEPGCGASTATVGMPFTPCKLSIPPTNIGMSGASK